MTEDKPKFTPGPWQIIPEDQAIHRWVIGAMDGCSIASCDPVGPWRSDDEATANAHVISAVPDMYEALRGLLDRYVGLVNSGDAGFWDPEKERPVSMARAALAKAEGRKT